MGVLSGVVSYLFGLALNLLNAAINGFLGALGFDLDTFEHYFPAAADYHEAIVGFGVGLLFQLFRNFGVMLDMEAEDPLKILGKTTLFREMILYSHSIVNTLLGLLADPYAIFLNTVSTPYEFQLTTLATAMFGSVFANPFMAIVTLILMLVLGWQFLKLTVECVERYIVFYFALYSRRSRDSVHPWWHQPDGSAVKQVGTATTDLQETAVSQAANQVELFQSAPNDTVVSASPQVPQPVGPPTISHSTETPPSVQPTEPLPPAPMVESPQNQVRRFSRSNPANLEVFQKDGGEVEAFRRPRPEQESGPQVSPPKKEKG